MLTSLLLGLLFVCVGAYLYSAECARQLDKRFAAAQGCQDPPLLNTGRWPFGLELVIRAFRIANEQRLLRFMVNIVQDTGPTFEQRLLGTRGVDTVDPVNLEAVLSKQFTHFGLGERRLVFAPLLGDGIFTQDGKAWEQSRALLRPAFHNQHESMAQIREAADEVLDRIARGVCIDLQPLFFRFTLDTTSYLLFGRRIGAVQQDKHDDMASFAQAFDSGQDYLAKRGRLGGLYWLIDGLDFRRQCRNVHDHLDRAIQQALQIHTPKDQSSTYSILGALIEHTRDPKVLREQCLNVLLAGRDTTACLLSWTFRLFARHPDVFQRCREEILDSKGQSAEVTRPDIKRMKYLDVVLKEVLRLYPSVPINSRVAVRTTTLPAGGGPDGKAPVLVRKGEAVGYCPYAMHRRKDIYGPDAAQFRPERWLENNGSLAANVGYGYLPFNAGPRMCLGVDFALTEASYLVVRILQNFDNVCLPDDEPSGEVGDERQKLTLVVCSADGCRVILS